jgi:hypothetical protein
MGRGKIWIFLGSLLLFSSLFVLSGFITMTGFVISFSQKEVGFYWLILMGAFLFGAYLLYYGSSLEFNPSSQF